MIVPSTIAPSDSPIQFVNVLQSANISFTWYNTKDA